MAGVVLWDGVEERHVEANERPIRRGSVHVSGEMIPILEKRGLFAELGGLIV